MEYLDYYDEALNKLGKASRDEVHEKALWHKTIHCWLYDADGNIYFQIRAGAKKLYTSASGHVLAGETVAVAFAREISEEIGLTLKTDNAQLIEITIWKMDKLKNGKMWRDRVFANVYMCQIDDGAKFNFDENEVLGLVKVDANECLNLLHSENKHKKIKAVKYSNAGTQNIKVGFNDFLVQQGEIAIIKYGKILQAIIGACAK